MNELIILLATAGLTALTQLIKKYSDINPQVVVGLLALAGAIIWNVAIPEEHIAWILAKTPIIAGCAAGIYTFLKPLLPKK